MLDRQSLVAGTSGITELEGAAADAVSPATFRLYSSIPKPRFLVGASGGVELEGAAADAVPPATLRLYSSTPKPRFLVGASGGVELEGVAADAVPLATLRWYASMLDSPCLLGGASDGTELEGAVTDVVCPGRWRRYSSLLKSPVGALEDPASTPTRKAPGPETSWPGAEDTLPCSPRSLLGGASGGTTLAGSGVEDLVFPARLRWYPSMLDCTFLLGGAAAIEDGPPTSTSPSS
jgi:hypothetical protein